MYIYIYIYIYLLCYRLHNLTTLGLLDILDNGSCHGHRCVSSYLFHHSRFGLLIDSFRSVPHGTSVSSTGRLTEIVIKQIIDKQNRQTDMNQNCKINTSATKVLRRCLFFFLYLPSGTRGKTFSYQVVNSVLETYCIL